MALMKLVDGVEVPASAEDLAQRDLDIVAVAADEAANGYKRRRAADFAREMPVVDQLEALLEGGQRLTDLRALYAEIKARYPRPV